MNVAIAGYGVEGKASARYWQAKGDTVTVIDEKPVTEVLPAGMLFVTGRRALQDLSGYDVVVRTASLRPDKLASAKKVWSATNEFFAECPAPIIGVTGTKGKGTTSSLIASILRAAGKTVHLVGNIGVPALEVLPNIAADDVVVYELSSFQLWDLERSPHVAVVLMVEPDHLDVHRDFDEYVAAKANIATHQTNRDTIVYNSTNEFASHIAALSPAHKIKYPFDISDFADSLQIPGSHNVENAAAAIAAVREYTTDPDTIRRGLSDFTGLPHRLKFVAEKGGVKYYDDSIATTPGSATAALHSFVEPKVIILGGSDKGASYDEIVNACLETGAQIVAIGQTGEKIHEIALGKGVVSTRVTGGMSEVVATASHQAAEGSVVILSPAGASFDQYQSYADRGDQFIGAVESLPTPS